MGALAKNSSSFSSALDAAELTVEGFAEELGVPPSLVAAWESGEKKPPHHVVATLEMLGQMTLDTTVIEETETVTSSCDKAERTEAVPSVGECKPATQAAPTLIKSKKRVADHGEVFTPPWLVEKMLDLVKGETERIDSRFLEPACGSGNFLVPILQRKLAAVEVKYGKSEFDKRHYALLALSSLYGIELLADNIAECRANMLDVFADYLGLEAVDVTYLAASHILSLNLIHGDAMSMKDVTGGPITVVEWAYLGKGKFNRRDFRLDVLTGMAGFKEEKSLFANIGRHEIFQPKKTYPPMTIKQLAAFEGEGFE